VLSVVTNNAIGTPLPLLTAHCPPPNTFNFTNAPASVAITSPVTSIRTIVSPAVFFASLNASSRLRSSLMSRAASGPESHLLHFLRNLIDPGIPVLLDEVEDPAHDRPTRQTTAEDQPPSATRPIIESTHSCSRKYWTAMAPPPIPVTTVLITPTAHSRCVRGGVISITTMVESSAPPAATPPAP
jgi:hypothetical protein